MSHTCPLSLDTLLEQAIHLAQCGGAALRHYWDQTIAIEQKSGYANLVTQVDQAAEAAILAELRQLHPEHSLLAEESGAQQRRHSRYTWVIDPLDGTTNYAHKYPVVAVSIGLLYDGEPVVGVIFNPILDELFYASKGGGSFLNGRLLRVSAVAQVSESLLASGFGYDRRTTADTNYPEFSAFTHASQGVRRGGSAALDLAYVAAGRFDGYWERGVQPWDIAAGILLVQEAGGVVTSYDASPCQLEQGELLATNGLLHDAMSRRLVELRRKRAAVSLPNLTMAAILSD